MPITIIGSLNQDLVSYTTRVPEAGETCKGDLFEKHLGGKGLNECIAVARLRSPYETEKISVRLWGKVGDDDAGQKFLEVLKNEKIDHSLVEKVDNTSSGTAVIIVETNSGENRILIIPGANDKLLPTNAEIDKNFPKAVIAKIDNPFKPSNIHSHSTKPLNDEPIAKTTDVSNHQPSHMHSHASSPSLVRLSNYDSNHLTDHTLPASNPNLKINHSNSNLMKNSPSFIHSHATKPPNEPLYKIQHSEPAIPSGLHAHASHPKFETLTYPSPKPSSIQLFKELNNANISNNLNDSSSSLKSLSPCESYLQLFANPNANLNRNVIDDTKNFVIIQNEFPKSYEVINYLSKNHPDVIIFYNPSPLTDFNDALLDALHNSTYIIVNEHEASSIISNFHPSADSKPLTLLRNESKNDLLDVEEVSKFIETLTKLRSLLTKPNLVMTLGSKGVIYSESGKFSFGFVSSNKVQNVVDTTGAGDTFLGSLVLSIYKNDNIDYAINFANKAASISVCKKGAVESIPYYKDVTKKGWIL